MVALSSSVTSGPFGLPGFLSVGISPVLLYCEWSCLTLLVDMPCILAISPFVLLPSTFALMIHTICDWSSIVACQCLLHTLLQNSPSRDVLTRLWSLLRTEGGNDFRI